MKKKKKEIILIVDDDAGFCASTCQFLENHGYEVLRALTGAEGLRIATEEQTDLILLDIDLGDDVVGGFEILTKIRERSIPTRIVMVTGLVVTTSYAFKYSKSGACDFWQKGDGGSSNLLKIIERNIRFENTLNFQVSNPAPIVEKLMARSQKIAVEKEALQRRVSQLERKLAYQPLLIASAVNLALLIVSVGITLLIRYFTSTADFWVTVLLPVVLFFILRLPIERFSKGTLSTPAVKGSLELESGDRNKSELSE